MRSSLRAIQNNADDFPWLRWNQGFHGGGSHEKIRASRNKRTGTKFASQVQQPRKR